MTIDDNIRDKKLQCKINREAAKISRFSSGKRKKQVEALKVLEQGKITET